MGNHRFRLSDMMPNAWFYKLKDMSRATRSNGGSHTMRRTAAAVPTAPKPFLPSHPPPSSKQPFIPNRASYYFPSGAGTEKLPISPKASDTHYPIDPPRKSKRKSRRKPTKPSPMLVTSSVSAGCNCRVWKSESMTKFICDGFNINEDDDLRKPITLDLDGDKSWSSSATDIIVDIDGKSPYAGGEAEKPKDLIFVSALELPPILTKPESDEHGQRTETLMKQSKNPAKKSPVGLHRLRMRASSPRIVSKKTHGYRKSIVSASPAMQRRKGLSESFVVVKKSSDPQREFRDSMVEMIVENNIRDSRDLEELLACYLTLNSNEYHDVIVKVFEQIWFDLTDIISCK